MAILKPNGYTFDPNVLILFFGVAVAWYLFACCSKEADTSDKLKGYLAAFVIVGCLIIWGVL
jgi:hypothetical protein